MHSKAIGEISEAIVMSRFLQRGWAVLAPWGDSQRYDFVIDRGLGFETVQVKTGRLRNGVVRFAASSVTYRRAEKATRHDYVGQVQWFAVYCPELDKVYLVPPGTKSMKCLRVTPAGNNQHDGITWAKDYELP